MRCDASRGDRGARQPARAVPAAPDDVREAGCSRRRCRAAERRRRGRGATASCGCARRTRRGSSCCASCSRWTTTRAEFAARFRHDPLLGPSIRGLHGLRPLRRATVAHAVLRAICGQLIESRRARALERAILRACGEPAPRREAIGALSPAQLRRLGLATPRASALVRLCRTIDLEGLRDQPLRRPWRPALPRARLRAVVARGRRARGARQLPLRARRRPGADQALLRAARPLGRGVGDGRAARALRRVGRAGAACT